MKKIFAILAFVLVGVTAFSQTWVNTGGNILTDPGFGAANYVGIKSTAPNADLTVGSTADRADLFIRTTYAPPTPTGNATAITGQMEIWGDPAGSYLYRNAVRLNSSSQYEMLQTIKTPTGNLAFLFVNFNTKDFRLREGIVNAYFENTGTTIFKGSQVGVGLTLPTDFKSGVKFQVNGGVYVEGRVRCTEVEVALATSFTWPDYVFSPNYKLRSLYDVESFITSNKHLPDVPSQAQIEKAGSVNLGEMNTTLLRKVEELTLYMINLQKENDALKARVTALEK